MGMRSTIMLAISGSSAGAMLSGRVALFWCRRAVCTAGGGAGMAEAAEPVEGVLRAIARNARVPAVASAAAAAARRTPSLRPRSIATGGCVAKSVPVDAGCRRAAGSGAQTGLVS